MKEVLPGQPVYITFCPYSEFQEKLTPTLKVCWVGPDFYYITQKTDQIYYW